MVDVDDEEERDDDDDIEEEEWGQYFLGGGVGGVGFSSLILLLLELILATLANVFSGVVFIIPVLQSSSTLVSILESVECDN